MKGLPFNSVYRTFLFFMIAVVFCACEGQKTIVHDLTEREANEILVFLEGKGIKADKTKAEGGGGAGGGEVKWNVVVSASKTTQAMALLNEAGLPRRTGKSLLEIFGQSGLVPSEQQEEIKFRAGLEQEIASTIRKIDGVLDADVRLSFPKEDPLNPQTVKGKVTASVYVKHSGILDDPNSHLIVKIRDFVASSVNRLNYDDVTIIPDRARFTDSVISDPTFGRKGEVELISIWGLTLSKNSLTRFRVVFFSFLVTILILIILVALLIWKIAPFLRLAGGFDKLFSTKSLLAWHKEKRLAMKRKRKRAESRASSQEPEEVEEEPDEDEDEDEEEE